LKKCILGWEAHVVLVAAGEGGMMGPNLLKNQSIRVKQIKLEDLGQMLKDEGSTIHWQQRYHQGIERLFLHETMGL